MRMKMRALKKLTAGFLTASLMMTMTVGMVYGMQEDGISEENTDRAAIIGNPVISDTEVVKYEGIVDSGGIPVKGVCTTPKVTYDCIWFGNYWQDDGAEKKPIKWRVLQVIGNDALILADRNLDSVTGKYNSNNSSNDMNNYSRQTSYRYISTQLERWLNGFNFEDSYNNLSLDFSQDNFIDNAFTEEEKNAIIDSGKKFEHPTDPAKDVDMKLFFLSMGELKTGVYGFINDNVAKDPARRAKNTAYAISKGAKNSTGYDSVDSFSGNGPWVCVTNANTGDSVSHADSSGTIGNEYLVAGSPYEGMAVRPALHLDLSSFAWSPAGTVSTDGGSDEGAGTGTGGIGGGVPVALADGNYVSNPRRDRTTSTWDCVWFGAYRQEDTDGDGDVDGLDAKQPVKWRVLSATEDDVFLMADKCLDAKAYIVSDKTIFA